MNMKGIIFDVDGTIIDSMPLWYNSGARYLKSIGVEPEKNLGDILFKMTLDLGVDYIIENYDIDKTKEEVSKGIRDVIEDFYINHSELKDGAREILEYFKEREIEMVVATSTEREYVEAAFKRLGIEDYFSRIYTCSEVGKCKSEPDIFMEAVSFLGTPIKETWVFEDGLYSIKTAKKEGFKIVGVYDEVSSHEQDEIKEYSDIYLKSFKDFFEIVE